MAATKAETIEVDGHEVRVSNPDKVFFPQLSVTKMEIVEYYLAVSEGALRGCFHRPTLLYRWPNGSKAIPSIRSASPIPARMAAVGEDHVPQWSIGHHAAPNDTAHIAWAINLGCIDLNPWPVRADDVDHPETSSVSTSIQPRTPRSRTCAGCRGGAGGPSRPVPRRVSQGLGGNAGYTST